jgi:hypothetical protein
MSINWNEQDGRWLFRGSHPHGGIVTLPVKFGEWQKMEAEITVPDVKEIAFISAGFSGENVRPGKIWISDVEMQIHPPYPPIKK